VNPRDHQALIVEVQRFRPFAAVLLAVLFVAPSCWELATGNLSAVTLLVRLLLALVVSGALVWAASGLILHYARVQAGAPRERDVTPSPDFDR
jgi:hypothetical protein